MQKVTKAKYLLKYQKPATTFAEWQSSLPIGNSNIGALVQGGVRYENIMITDSRATWLGSVGVLPDISDKIKEVRKSVDSKNQVYAGMVIEKAFEVKKYNPLKTCNLPVADLVIEQNIKGKHIKNYYRQLNMENGEVSVGFNDNGTKIDRSCFASFANNMLVYEISKEGNSAIDLELGLVPHDYKCIAFNGEYSPLPKVTHQVGSSFVCINLEHNGINYGVALRVVTDSKAIFQIINNKLKIENAEKVVLLIKTYVGKNASKEIEQIKNELLAIKLVSYDKLFKEHLTIYTKAFGKTELCISDEKENSVENLISNFNENSTLLYEKMFHFAKYLSVCGLPENDTLASSTGLWSYHYANTSSAVDSCCTLPALYSLCVSMGQDDKIKSVVDYFVKYSDDLKKNAFRIYKSKGYMVPNYIAFGTGLTASTKASDIATVSGGAVIANMFYEYFLITKDVRLLKNTIFPFMLEISNFYMNYFYLNAQGTELVCCPSYSPFGKSKFFENKQVGVYQNCTADITVVRSLISCILKLSNEYNLQVPNIMQMQEFLNNLPKIRIEKNELKEYALDENSDLSAGFLHMYPVYGTRAITANSSSLTIAPYLAGVAQKIDKGLFAQNIVSLGRLAEIASILGHGDATFNILRYMIANFLSANLMFLNYDKNNLCAFVGGDNYFNIAGSSLFASSFISCFVLDYDNNIAILNAKPMALKSAEIKSVFTRQNVVVDVSYDDKKGICIVELKALKNTTFNCILFKGVKKVKGYDIDPQNPFIENIKLLSGKSLTLEIKY